MKRRNAKRANRKKRSESRVDNEGARGEARGRSFDSPEFVRAEDPFYGLEGEERERAITIVAEATTQQLSQGVQFLREQLATYHPLTILGILTFYGLTRLPGEAGSLADIQAQNLNQADIEFVQGLMLCLSIDEAGRENPSPQVVQQIWDQLKNLGHNYSLSRIADVQAAESQAERALVMLQEEVRRVNMSVRNWGYSKQVEGIVMELYSPFDEIMVDQYGFSASNCMTFFSCMADTIQTRIVARYETLAEVAAQPTKAAMVRHYHQLVGEDADSAESFIERHNLKSVGKRRLMAFLASHNDQQLGELFLVDSKELSVALDVPERVVSNICDQLSLSPGDLSDFEQDRLFLGNPIREKPLIRNGGDFYCFVPYIFHGFSLDILDGLISEIDKVALHRRRSAFLEEKIASIVSTRFPDATIVRGLKWKEGESEYETDLAVFIDSHVLVVEAKSQKVSKSALRGAPERMKRHVEEIIVAPALQSQRFENRIRKNLTGGEIDADLQERVPIKVDRIKRVLRVSVSLDDLAGLQSQFHTLRECGWISREFVDCPTMTVADLETVFDLLDHPVQIIHYFTRRTELLSERHLEGDEIDFLGFYLQTLLAQNAIAGDEQTKVQLTALSDSIDNYYNTTSMGRSCEKPRPGTSRFFENIIERLEQRETYRWTEIGVILNRIPPSDQLELRRQFKVLAKVVHKRWHEPNHKNMIIYHGGLGADYAFAFVLYKNGNRDLRTEFMQSASAHALDESPAKFCLVLAANIDDESAPYHAISLVERERGAFDEQ